MNNQDKRTEADAMQDVRKAKAAYAKQWRDKHPEKWREITNRYWMKKAAQMQEQASTTDNDNKEV